MIRLGPGSPPRMASLCRQQRVTVVGVIELTTADLIFVICGAMFDKLNSLFE
jgi:hypothetical protein